MSEKLIDIEKEIENIKNKISEGGICVILANPEWSSAGTLQALELEKTKETFLNNENVFFAELDLEIQEHLDYSIELDIRSIPTTLITKGFTKDVLTGVNSDATITDRINQML